MALTYTPIATTTLGSNQTTVTFSSIPSTYTDLILIVSAFSTQTGTSSNGLRVTFNSDTSTNYSGNYLYGDGTTAGAGNIANVAYATLGSISQTSATAPWFSVNHIMNYSNAATYKTILTRDGAAFESANIWLNMWRNTSAINRIDIQRDGTNQIKTGSTFTLYGVTAA